MLLLAWLGCPVHRLDSHLLATDVKPKVVLRREHYNLQMRQESVVVPSSLG